MEPRKHVSLQWIEWNALWTMIRAELADHGEEKESGDGKMRFFLSMKNMVRKYPTRFDATCLEQRQAQPTVAWISPLRVEYNAAVRAMGETCETEDNGYLITRAIVNRHHVVVVHRKVRGIGATSAAAYGSYLQSTFPDLQLLLLVGTGGGIAESDVQLGDVVVWCPGSRLHSEPRDQDWAHRAKPVGENVTTALTELRSSPPTLKVDSTKDCLYQWDYDHNGERRDCSKCDPAKLVRRDPRDPAGPVIRYGGVAPVSQVVRDTRERRKYLGYFCLEMESPGLLETTPTVVCRGISDYADSHKNDLWQGFASSQAATVAICFLRHLEPFRHV